MNTFKVALSEYTELTVSINKHSIDIESTDAFDLNDGLKAVELELENVLAESFPKDWKFIMHDEDYGQFLTLGSPQMMECGWKLTYYTEAYLTRISITNIDA